VGWYLGDTTESLGLIEAKQVDVALTYVDAAEQQSLKSGASIERVYGFRVSALILHSLLQWLMMYIRQDHFMLVGPSVNPAQLDVTNDDVLTMFNKIVARGNADVVVCVPTLELEIREPPLTSPNLTDTPK
jgi:ABC-type tungstate transport system permease subunit